MKKWKYIPENYRIRPTGKNTKSIRVISCINGNGSIALNMNNADEEFFYNTSRKIKEKSICKVITCCICNAKYCGCLLKYLYDKRFLVFVSIKSPVNGRTYICRKCINSRRIKK